jgi:hypothetical protein
VVVVGMAAMLTACPTSSPESRGPDIPARSSSTTGAVSTTITSVPPACRPHGPFPEDLPDVDGDGRRDFAYHAYVNGEPQLGVCTASGSEDVLPGSGMTEEFGWVDLEPDGREELLYGGTTVSAGFENVAVFLNGQLVEVRTSDGEMLTLASGVFDEEDLAWGCEDHDGDGIREFVQVTVSADSRGTRQLHRVWYRLKGASAVQVDAASERLDSRGPIRFGDHSQAADASPGCPNAFPADPKLFTDAAFVEGRHRQLLTAPAEPTIKLLSPGQGCSALIDRGWRGRCARFSGAAGAGIWILERRDGGRQKRVLLYTHRGGSTWDLVLRASDETGVEFEPRVETVDLAGDGDQRVLVLLREVDADANDGVPPPLVVDVVEPDGKIAVHLFTSAGRTGPAEARASRGRGLEVWDCDYDCGPTNPSFRYRRIAYSSGKVAGR